MMTWRRILLSPHRPACEARRAFPIYIESLLSPSCAMTITRLLPQAGGFHCGAHDREVSLDRRGKRVRRIADRIHPGFFHSAHEVRLAADRDQSPGDLIDDWPRRACGSEITDPAGHHESRHRLGHGRYIGKLRNPLLR